MIRKKNNNGEQNETNVNICIINDYHDEKYHDVDQENIQNVMDLYFIL